ncbi:hypothetical protein ScPMuIL_013534 [Solemya velum]
MEPDRESRHIFDDEAPPYRRPIFLSYITAIARTWGIITVIALWAATVTTLDDYFQENTGEYVGWYLVCAAIVVTFFEITWILNKSACCSREGCCCRCWSIIMWVDNWKKGVFYILISVPLFLQGLQDVLGIITAFLLIICGCLYIVKTFRYGMVTKSKADTRYVKSYSPPVRMVTHEISTQTEDDNYYEEMAQRYQQ